MSTLTLCHKTSSLLINLSKLQLLCRTTARCGCATSLTRMQHNSPVSRGPDVCQSRDKKMLLCWHPEPDFPYELTQPIIYDKATLEEGDSVLKVQYLVEEKMKNRPDGPTISEVSQLVHVPVFTFKRRQRHEMKMDIKYKPKDREGL